MALKSGSDQTARLVQLYRFYLLHHFDDQSDVLAEVLNSLIVVSGCLSLQKMESQIV